MALVAIGDAVTFVGENISDMASQTSMTWRPVEGLYINLSEYVTWCAKASATPVVRTLIDSAREVLASKRTDAARVASGRSSRRHTRKR